VWFVMWLLKDTEACRERWSRVDDFSVLTEFFLSSYRACTYGDDGGRNGDGIELSPEYEASPS
jgi:hypothetical protein